MAILRSSHKAVKAKPQHKISMLRIPLEWLYPILSARLLTNLIAMMSSLFSSIASMATFIDNIGDLSADPPPLYINLERDKDETSQGSITDGDSNVSVMELDGHEIRKIMLVRDKAPMSAKYRSLWLVMSRINEIWSGRKGNFFTYLQISLIR